MLQFERYPPEELDVKTSRLTLWFLVFGLLPFWVSIVNLILGSKGSTSNYWAVAPWLVILSIPYCFITLGIAGATYKVYDSTSGCHSRKLKYAGRFFVVLSIVAIVVVKLIWYWYENKEKEAKAIQESGRILVERSALVGRIEPSKLVVSRYMSQFNVLKQTGRFTYSVHSIGESNLAFIAIVDVSQGSAGAQLRISCVIAERDYMNRQAGSDPC